MLRGCSVGAPCALPCVCPQFTLGGFEALQAMKVRRREELGLPPLPEDSIQVVRGMRAASPPTCAIELVEQQPQQPQQPKRSHRSRRVRAGAPARPGRGLQQEEPGVLWL